MSPRDGTDELPHLVLDGFDDRITVPDGDQNNQKMATHECLSIIDSFSSLGRFR